MDQHKHQYQQRQNQSQYPSVPPRKKSRLGWILGGTALAVTLLCVLAFVGCSALVQDINGGGGSQAEKAADMKARADRVPKDGWVQVFREDPKVDPGCLSIDTMCLKLSAQWQVDHKVSLDEVASRFGMKSASKEGTFSGRYMGCIKTEPDGIRRESLCIQESPEDADSYVVTIQMERR